MGDQLEGEELEREFECAADRVRDLVQTASRDQLLYLYARYKQVSVTLSHSVGDITISNTVPCILELDPCIANPI